MNGRLLALTLMAATVALVIVGTVWPVHAALVYTGGEKLVRSSSTPEAALQNLGDDIRSKNLQKAYESLANKGQFSLADFQHDLSGAYQNLRTYSDLGDFEIRPLHQSADDAEFQVMLHWITVVGDAVNTRDVHVVRNGGTWQVQWPTQKEPVVPPQVIPVNYLRWDVIYRGAGDDWGAADVESPHVRIIDMHPLQRAEGLVLMGELLNEDVVPAYVSVTATLLGKNQQPLETETSFDKIQHLLLPKQVTPFLIHFANAQLSQVGGVRMTPFSQLVSASADPVIAIQNEKLNPAPDPSVSGELVNQSGQIANVAHVLSTFYDKSGNLVWVADQYVDRALLPQTPVPFVIRIPMDLAKNVSSDRTIISSYSVGEGQ